MTKPPVQDMGGHGEGAALGKSSSLHGVSTAGQGVGNTLLMRSQAPLPDRAKRATQGGDLRCALTQAGPAPVSARNLTLPRAQTLYGRCVVADTVVHDPSVSSGLVFGDPILTTESAPLHCPEWEGRSWTPRIGLLRFNVFMARTLACV